MVFGGFDQERFYVGRSIGNLGSQEGCLGFGKLCKRQRTPRKLPGGCSRENCNEFLLELSEIAQVSSRQMFLGLLLNGKA